MHCGKATSQEGKDVHSCVVSGEREVCVCVCMCALSTRAGLIAAVAHVRRRRIQGCLIRQVMIAKWGRPGKGERSRRMSKQQQQQPSRSSPRPPSQPNTFSPSYCFPSSTADGYARRGKARQGNVRQCKARQGNKAVLDHAAPPAPSHTVLAQSAAF